MGPETTPLPPGTQIHRECDDVRGTVTGDSVGCPLQYPVDDDPARQDSVGYSSKRCSPSWP